MQLQKHQEEAVLAILNAYLIRGERSFLLADDTGLGKTYTALAVAKKMHQLGLDILVITTASLIQYWHTSAKIVGVPITTSTYGLLSRGNIQTLQNKYFILYDEAQYLRNEETNMALVAQYLNTQAATILYITATPTQNPLKAGYLNEIMGIHDYRHWLNSAAKFTLKGCSIDRYTGKLLWKTNQQDMELVRAYLYSKGLTLRRTAQDLNGWPELLIKETIITADSEIITQNFTQLRQVLSQFKVPTTIQLTQDNLDAGHQVAIYAPYKKTQQSLNHFLPNAKVINGDTPKTTRQELVDAFTAGTLTTLIFSICEGINLQQPSDQHPRRVQINHDLPLSGIQATQLYGRCHRNGRCATNYNVSTDHRTELGLNALLTSRHKFIHGILQPPTELYSEAEILKILTQN